jgi:hypothetical protein
MSAYGRLCRGLSTGLLLSATALPLAGCFGATSDDPGAWYNRTVMENITGRPDTPAPGYAASGTVPAANGAPAMATTGAIPGAAPVATTTPPGAVAVAVPGAPPDSELYRSEAGCGGITLGTGAPPSMAASQSVSLDMTECDVARRLGAPDRIALSSGDGGQRLLTLTYGRGEHPRLYRFASGRLYSIEALPPPLTATRSKPAHTSSLRATHG